MIGCIWSCPTDQMLRFPVATMLRFCHNHGLLQVTDRPQWHTVRGGSRHYVERILDGLADVRLATPVRHVRRGRDARAGGGVEVCSDAGTERFDDVVLACHSDQALALLADARRRRTRSPRRDPLPAQPRRAAHRRLGAADAPRAWAAWNYERAADGARERASVCLHYLINRLQPLPFTTPVVVSLNPVARTARGSACTATSTTRTRSSMPRRSMPSSGCRRCRASTGPGSAAPGRATASTRTA